MASTCEKKIPAEARLIHVEQISLYKFYRFKKKQQTQLKIQQVKQDVLNQWESMGFKLIKKIMTLIHARTWIYHKRHSYLVKGAMFVIGCIYQKAIVKENYRYSQQKVLFLIEFQVQQMFIYVFVKFISQSYI